MKKVVLAVLAIAFVAAVSSCRKPPQEGVENVAADGTTYVEFVN